MDWWLVVDVVITFGLIVRLTRAVTVEDIGGRFLRWPARRWADRPLAWAAPRYLTAARRRWWADALSCPYCVSVHIAWASLLILVLVEHLGGGWLWAYRIVAAACTFSYIGAHLMVALGDTDDSDFDDEYDDQEQPVS